MCPRCTEPPFVILSFLFLKRPAPTLLMFSNPCIYTLDPVPAPPHPRPHDLLVPDPCAFFPRNLLNKRTTALTSFVASEPRHLVSLSRTRNSHLAPFALQLFSCREGTVAPIATKTRWNTGSTFRRPGSAPSPSGSSCSEDRRGRDCYRQRLERYTERAVVAVAVASEPCHYSRLVS